MGQPSEESTPGVSAAAPWNNAQIEAAKWEYLVVGKENRSWMNDELNERAKEGWEIHTFTVAVDKNGKLQWEALLRRDTTPPFVPSASGAVGDY